MAESLNEWVVVNIMSQDKTAYLANHVPPKTASSYDRSLRHLALPPYPGSHNMTIQKLQAENKCLKERIRELEEGLDNAMQAIDAIQHGSEITK